MKKIDYRFRHKIIRFIKSIDLIGFRYISHKLPYLLIPKPKEKYIIKTLHDFDIVINPIEDKGLEKTIYYQGTYELGTLNLIEIFLEKNDIFLDIGANIGLMSIFASKQVGNDGKVFSFEANPDTVKLIEENIKINSLNNITIYPFALGSRNEKVKIYTNIDLNRGSASIVNISDKSKYHEVDMYTLNTIFESIPKIKLLKMDIEGYELEALKGMGILFKERDSLPIMIIECGEEIKNTKLSKFSVYEFVMNLKSYSVFKLKNGKGKFSKLVKINSDSDLPTHDNMVCIPNSELLKYSKYII
jgi:FkbM family methyltransferase